jgi:HK97 family phage prohead protease
VRFAGYAAVFDRVDRGGDLVRRGAFGPTARAVPLLWEHKGQAIGRCELVKEDARGLRVIARVTDERAAALVRERAVTGLSFGYRVLAARGARPRELTGLELVEVSLVSLPMQTLARVHAVETPAPHPKTNAEALACVTSETSGCRAGAPRPGM